jgi:hypothetical protein
MITKLSWAFCAVRLMFHVAPTLESVNFTDFNGSSYSEKIFALQNKDIRSFCVCKTWNFILKSVYKLDIFTCSMPMHISINEFHCKWPSKFSNRLVTVLIYGISVNFRDQTLTFQVFCKLLSVLAWKFLTAYDFISRLLGMKRQIWNSINTHSNYSVLEFMFMNDSLLYIQP